MELSLMSRLKCSVFILSLVVYITKTIDSQKIGDVVKGRCTLCKGLNECSSLNGFELPDTIYGYTRSASSQLPEQGVCFDMDSKAQVVKLFGPGFQFKDIDYCRGLVNRYNCLAWASRSNSCSVAPKPPCRSMCVEVAESCIFPHLYRFYLDNVCARIPCAYEETICTVGSNEEKAGFDKCTLHQFKPGRNDFSFAFKLQYNIFFSNIILGVISVIIY